MALPHFRKFNSFTKTFFPFFTCVAFAPENQISSNILFSLSLDTVKKVYTQPNAVIGLDDIMVFCENVPEKKRLCSENYIENTSNTAGTW